ncbi:hypothetical protein QRE66_11065 [Bacillus cereus]|nr:hypothetical protein QRE66_11065 [Bacillus cereus]
MVTEFFNVNDSIIAADWTLLNVTPIGRIGKGIKYVGKKAGKALLDVAKKVPSKVKEGVSFVASKTKSLVDKVGDLWNKGKTKVKNDFIEADKAFRYAMKKLGEYVPKSGRGLAFETQSAGKIPSGGKNLLQDAYQYVKDTGERVFGRGAGETPKRTYEPSPKHDPKSGWGSPNPIPDAKTGQKLLDTAYSSSKNKQLYNIYDGKLIKFQPDGETGWHPYEVMNPAKEVPADVLRKLLKDEKLTKAEYKRLLKNK